MKKLLLSLVLVLVPVFGSAQTVTFHAFMNGASEFPGPGDPDGSGSAVVTITGTVLTYSVVTSDIGPATVAHIHRAPAGVSGPPVVDLNVGSLSGGTANISQALANEIIGNPATFYVNVHTGDFPNGAVRGQLVRTSSGTRSAYFPVVGKVVGLNNTNFVTDMRILNHGAVPANVTLEFFAQSLAGQTGPTHRKVVTVEPNEQKAFDDVVGETLDTGGLGAVRVISDQNVTVTTRVINDLRGDSLGTSGFAIDPKALGDATTAGTLTFLIQDGDFRTNIGFFNPSPTTASATFTARRANGTILGSATITVAPFAMVQQPVFALIGNVPELERIQHNFYVTWTTSIPMFVYASVIDFKTGDSVYID